MYDLCIIGGGISGISTAKYAKINNLNFILLDKNNKLGGCWVNKNYPNLKSQTDKYKYKFSDFDFNSNVGFYAKNNDIINYLNDYCLKFNLLNNIKLNSEVKFVKNKDNIWIINYSNNFNNFNIKSKFLCIATGFYSDNYIPKIKGINLYKGELHHVQEWSEIKNKSISDFQNKNILIIGNGPSGCDMGALACKNAKKVTIIYRKPRWILERNKIILNLFINKYTFYIYNKINSKILLFIFRAIYKILMYIKNFINNYNIKLEIPNELPSKKNVVNTNNLIPLIAINKINYIKGNIIKFDDKSIYIDINKNIVKLNPDLIIMATGYKNDIPIFNYNTENLYKKILHPELKNVGFIGFIPTFNWMYTSEMQSKWFINYIIGNIKLSSKLIFNELNNNHNLDKNDYSYRVTEYINLLRKDLDNIL